MKINKIIEEKKQERLKPIEVTTRQRLISLISLAAILLSMTAIIFSMEDHPRHVYLFSDRGVVGSYYASYAKPRDQRIYFCLEQSRNNCATWHGRYLVADEPLTNDEIERLGR